jgi:hypothetical protein
LRTAQNCGQHRTANSSCARFSTFCFACFLVRFWCFCTQFSLNVNLIWRRMFENLILWLPKIKNHQKIAISPQIAWTNFLNFATPTPTPTLNFQPPRSHQPTPTPNSNFQLPILQLTTHNFVFTTHNFQISTHNLQFSIHNSKV